MSMVVTLAYAIGQEEANRVEQAHRGSSFQPCFCYFSRRDLVDRLRLAVLVHPTFALRSPLAYSALAMTKPYTAKQGQYLAFIYYYSKIHGRPPAEAEMQQYFRVSPPSVHQMILTLETHGLVERTPGQARSIRLLISREELPDLV